MYYSTPWQYVAARNAAPCNWWAFPAGCGCKAAARYARCSYEREAESVPTAHHAWCAAGAQASWPPAGGRQLNASEATTFHRTGRRDLLACQEATPVGRWPQLALQWAGASSPMESAGTRRRCRLWLGGCVLWSNTKRQMRATSAGPLLLRSSCRQRGMAGGQSDSR